MTDPALDTLTRRLDRLERSRRNSRVVLAVVLIVLAGTLLYALLVSRVYGAAAPDIRVQRLTLVDQEGKSRATLELDHKRSKGGVVLTLFDAAQKERLALSVLPGGWPSLALNDPNQRIRAILTLTEDTWPTISFFDKDGKVIWKAP